LLCLWKLLTKFSVNRIFIVGGNRRSAIYRRVQMKIRFGADIVAKFCKDEVLKYLFDCNKPVCKHRHSYKLRTSSVSGLQDINDRSNAPCCQRQRHNSKMNNQHSCALRLLNCYVPNHDEGFTQCNHRNEHYHQIHDLQALDHSLLWLTTFVTRLARIFYVLYEVEMGLNHRLDNFHHKQSENDRYGNKIDCSKS